MLEYYNANDEVEQMIRRLFRWLRISIKVIIKKELEKKQGRLGKNFDDEKRFFFFKKSIALIRVNRNEKKGKINRKEKLMKGKWMDMKI